MRTTLAVGIDSHSLKWGVHSSKTFGAASLYRRVKICNILFNYSFVYVCNFGCFMRMYRAFVRTYWRNSKNWTSNLHKHVRMKLNKIKYNKKSRRYKCNIKHWIYTVSIFCYTSCRRTYRIWFFCLNHINVPVQLVHRHREKPGDGTRCPTLTTDS